MKPKTLTTLDFSGTRHYRQLFVALGLFMELYDGTLLLNFTMGLYYRTLLCCMMLNFVGEQFGRHF